jgi:hypothetical protein
MKLIPVSAAVLAAALTLVTTASALPSIPPPPAGTSEAASEVFAALLGLARAGASNPGAVQGAAQTYATAVQQYNAGNFSGAMASAQSVLAATAPAPLPQPSLYPLLIPQPAFLPIANPVNIDQAYAAGNVAVAHQSMALCGPVNASPPPAVVAQFGVAVNALVDQRYNAASTAAAIVVTACGKATQAFAAQQAALPQAPSTPIPMESYVPLPVATLIPDPALKQNH